MCPWRVHPVTATGFTIELQRPTLVPVSFAWHAFVTVDSEETLLRRPRTGEVRDLPLDSAGVPVSSDAVWNACIRRVTMLD
jgi:hypothetical protein